MPALPPRVLGPRRIDLQPLVLIREARLQVTYGVVQADLEAGRAARSHLCDPGGAEYPPAAIGLRGRRAATENQALKLLLPLRQCPGPSAATVAM